MSAVSRQEASPEDWQAAGFGIYVHWPFCAAKCPYCDFNSHVSAQIDEARWRAAYRTEIKRMSALTPGRVVRSVFLGGGTPSLMNPRTVAAILDGISAHWPLANDVEITLEANPTSVDATRFRGYAEAGVNRVSMGIQALNDEDLRALGRLHSANEAMRAFNTARNLFERVSFDLIYARQNQTAAQWESELRRALSMAVDHLSLYQLTIEQGTAFGRRYEAGKLHGLPDDVLSADLYDLTQDICEAHGLPAYEISNHAHPGAQSEHNLLYWRYGDYAGIGPGAHGRLTIGGTRQATSTPHAPGAWLEAVERGKGWQSEALSQRDQAVEALLMGLRLREGVDMARFTTLAGKPLSTSTVQRLCEEGWLAKHTASHLAATPKGRPLLNEILRQLLNDF